MVSTQTRRALAAATALLILFSMPAAAGFLTYSTVGMEASLSDWAIMQATYYEFSAERWALSLDIMTVYSAIQPHTRYEAAYSYDVEFFGGARITAGYVIDNTRSNYIFVEVSKTTDPFGWFGKLWAWATNR